MTPRDEWRVFYGVYRTHGRLPAAGRRFAKAAAYAQDARDRLSWREPGHALQQWRYRKRWSVGFGPTFNCRCSVVPLDA